jgi:hypothetical protein
MLVSTVLAAVLLSFAAPADDDGFTPLFNGKDLTGWVTPDDKTLFSVEDGVILGKTKGDLKKNEFLVTEKTYGDLHLKAKVKFTSGNSGIQFHSKRAPDGVVSGPQADIAHQYWGLFYEEKGRGILEQHPEAKKLVHENDWNDMEIIAKADNVKILLNGTQVVDRTDAELAKEGVIALQVHVGPVTEVRFKDIRVKPL